MAKSPDNTVGRVSNKFDDNTHLVYNPVENKVVANCRRKVNQHGNARIFGTSIQLAEPEAEAATFNYRRHVVDSDSLPRRKYGALREVKSATKVNRNINLTDLAVSNDLKTWFTSAKQNKIPEPLEPNKY